MKKFIKYILVAASAICMSVVNANADSGHQTGSYEDYPGGNDNTNRHYFQWTGTNTGCLLGNRTEGHHGNEFLVHVKKVNGSYHFYCDEDCTIEATAVGFTNNWLDTNILWMTLAHSNGDMPRDFTDFVARLSQRLQNAIDAVSYTNGFTSFHNEFNAAPLQIRFCVHSTIVLDSNIEHHQTADFAPNDQKVIIYSFREGCHTSRQPQKIWFERSSDFDDQNGTSTALISIEPDYAGGVSAAETRYMNVSFATPIIEIDNKTTDNNDIAVNVNHNGLLMLQKATITNSLGTNGTGVRLSAADGVTPYHNASVELGNDQSGYCDVSITNQTIGIDAYAGVVRLKRTNGAPVSSCTNALVISKGVFLGKWADDITSFLNTSPEILLRNPSDWASGDIVMASGRTRAEQHIGPQGQVVGEYICAMNSSDKNYLSYYSATDITKLYNIRFDQSGTPENVDYEYPVFRLDLPDILNTRTDVWYPTLYDALNDSEHPVQDNDELVYYGNITEFKSVTINNNIHIRSAKYDYQPDIVARNGHEISVNGYVSYYSGTDANFITVSTGKTVTFGDYENSSSVSVPSGSYTIDMGQRGRAIDAIGTVNANAHFAIRNGKITSGSNPNGGAIRIRTTGTLNLTDASFSGNTASGYGNAIYQDGTMNVSGRPTFGTSDFVYLPEGKVITKVGAFTPTTAVPVKLQNEVNGRDILVSNPGVQSTDPGVVSGSDLTNLNVVLSTENRFVVAYNASGLNGGGSPANVIELQEGHGDILIKKTGMKAPDSVEFTVCLAGSPTPVYTVVLSGIDNQGSEVSVTIKDIPVGSYTVAETGWSWTYSSASSSITHDVIPDSCTEFAFVNTEDTTKPDHAESNKNNVFN